MIDFSCADEIVAKLLLRYARRERAARGVLPLSRRDATRISDAIETVLERHGLALVAQAEDGAVVLVGIVG